MAKATKSSEAYVYYVRWADKKRSETTPKKAKKKAQFKSPRSRLIQEVFQAEKALEVISPPDMVNHPPHYKAGGIETIDFIEAKDLNYRLGNVVKYVSRAGKKSSDPVQDLEKAMFYLKREIDARKSA